MKKSYKPEGYNSLAPYLIVKDAGRLMDMLKQVFQAIEKRKYSRPDGSIMHAEMQIDDSIVMLADATEQFTSLPVWLHLYVPDVDSTFQKAIQFGCESIEKPIQKEGDPDKSGYFRDESGNYWAIGTQIN